MTDRAPAAPTDGRVGHVVAVDVGGTFTDVVVADVRTGALVSLKTPTTSGDPSAGFGEGIRLGLAAAGIDPGSIGQVRHGTTIATNAILEARGARTALVCTRGFRHVLEIGRHDGPRRTSLLHWIKPERPIPPDRIFEVDERVTHEGIVEREIDERAVGEIVRQLRAAEVEAVAVCLINSYSNDANERRLRFLLRAALPEVPITISADVLPVFREYERTMATALNAALVPLVGRYLERLSDRLAEIGIDAGVLVMQSNGGMDRAVAVQDQPVRTVLSGPAAAVIGAMDTARSAGFTDIVSLDIGGTSSDVAVVRNMELDLTDEGAVGPWPLSLPMVDLHTIGAGGGSIARVEAGNLRVGPDSAGSRPGPACYGLGGEWPTVTDAQVVLGRIAGSIGGGTVALDHEAAFDAIRSRVAEPLGLDPHEAAWGVVELADHSVAAAIRLISTERGRDPRGHVLVAGGGAGPLHAANVAGILGIDTILVPGRPGVLSALGLLVGEPRRAFLRTSVASLAGRPPDEIRALFRDLERDAAAWFEDLAVDRQHRATRWSVSLRYPEQPSELAVPWPGRRVDRRAIDRVAVAFRAQHRERYGYELADAPVEMVTVRVDAIARSVLPELRFPPGTSTGPGRPKAERRVYVDRSVGFASAPVFDRLDLPPGCRFPGPAVVEQPDSTVFVPPGFGARIDRLGNLLLTRGTRP